MARRLAPGLRARAESRERQQRKAAKSLASQTDDVIRRTINRALRQGPDALLDLPRRIEAALEKEFTKAARTSYNGWNRAIKASTRATRGAGAPTDARVKGWVDRGIKGKTWRDRLAIHGRTVARAVLQAQQEGGSRRAIARAAAESLSRMRADAATLARTESHRIDQLARDQAAKDVAGDRLSGWSYATAKDERVRPHHRRREGKFYAVGAKRIPLPDGPNCRCYYLPVYRAIRVRKKA